MIHPLEKQMVLSENSVDLKRNQHCKHRVFEQK